MYFNCTVTLAQITYLPISSDEFSGTCPLNIKVTDYVMAYLHYYTEHSLKMLKCIPLGLVPKMGIVTKLN